MRQESDAREAAEQISAVLDRIAADRLDCNVSIKLTQIGFDLGPAVVRANVRRILERAGVGAMLRIADADVAPAREQMAIARIARRQYAIEHVNARLHAVDQIFGRTHAHKIAR